MKGLGHGEVSLSFCEFMHFVGVILVLRPSLLLKMSRNRELLV